MPKVKNGAIFYHGQKLNVGHVEYQNGDIEAVHINGAVAKFPLAVTKKGSLNSRYDFKGAVRGYIDIKIKEAEMMDSEKAITFLRRAGIGSRAAAIGRIG